MDHYTTLFLIKNNSSSYIYTGQKVSNQVVHWSVLLILRATRDLTILASGPEWSAYKMLEVLTMKKLQFNADVDSFKNDRNDMTTITLKVNGKDVNLSQLREMKQTATVQVVIESNQTELIKD